MKKSLEIATVSLMLVLLLAGCASEDGGQIVSGILQGVGQGLSGL